MVANEGTFNRCRRRQWSASRSRVGHHRFQPYQHPERPKVYFSAGGRRQGYIADQRHDEIMKRVLPALLSSAALVAAQENPPTEPAAPQQQAAPAPQQQVAPQQQAAPQQPVQNFLQPTLAVPSKPAPAQGGAAPAQGSGGQSQSAAPGGGSNFLGKDVPFFDPGNNIATWDGKN